MQFRQAILIANGQTHLLQPNKANSFDDLYVDFGREDTVGGQRWSVFLHPKQNIVVQQLEVQFHIPLPAGSRFFANGYQSWNESRLLHLDETMAQRRVFSRRQLDGTGGGSFPGMSRKRGHLHSWTFTYLKKPSSTILAGSLSERTGFTLFLFDQATGILTVRKDLDQLPVMHSFPALDFWLGESTEKDVFDAWFLAMGLQKPAAMKGLGWSTGQIRPHLVTADLVTQHLENVGASQLPFQYFLVEDGWQRAVGDWFSVKQTFPLGLADMASKIRDKGLKPALWLAPFAVSANAGLVRQNPDWFLKDAKGKLLEVGWNPQWAGGWYYALDFYNKSVRDFLSGLFHTVLDKWGFDLVKLDFLFAACVAPPPGKTRGAVMWEVMEFLREQVGNRQMLACGVPLGACFGQVDYCRVSGERVSIMDVLRSTLGRWQLQDRAFVNDPGMFMLRTEKQPLSPIQQNTILTVDALLGGLLFTDDDLGQYSPEQISELESALDLRDSVVREVLTLQDEVYRIDFESKGSRYSAFCNLTPRTVALERAVTLMPFETLVLRQ